jgi:hypothetical protein
VKVQIYVILKCVTKNGWFTSVSLSVITYTLIMDAETDVLETLYVPLVFVMLAS